MNAHFALGTHRLLEPVSNTTWNDCGGVPSSMAPKYCASMKLVMGTDASSRGFDASNRAFRNRDARRSSSSLARALAARMNTRGDGSWRFVTCTRGSAEASSSVAVCGRSRKG